MSQTVFNRVEKKFLLTNVQYENLMSRMKPFLQEDKFSNYSIRNIYFDTENDELIRTSIEKPEYKEKFRIRCYVEPSEDTDVFLEIKKKYKGIVNKRRIILPYQEVNHFLYTGKAANVNEQIAREITYCIQHYELKPKLYLAYDRSAFFAKENPEVRITFDYNIRSRWENLTLKSDEKTNLLMKPGYKIMEVKVKNAFPLWLVKILSELEIHTTSFSKYGTIYKQKITKEVI